MRVKVSFDLMGGFLFAFNFMPDLQTNRYSPSYSFYQVIGSLRNSISVTDRNAVGFRYIDSQSSKRPTAQLPVTYGLSQYSLQRILDIYIYIKEDRKRWSLLKLDNV